MKPSEWFCWLVLDWVTWPCKIWATNHLSGFVANSKYKIQALFTDFQGPKLHFSSTKIIDKKPYPRRGHSKFRLQCDTEVYCTVLTNTVIIKASDKILFPSTGDKHTSACFKIVNKCKMSKFAKILIQGLFKDFLIVSSTLSVYFQGPWSFYSKFKHF